MSKIYVYEHFDPRTGSTFYVGCGTHRRARAFDRRNEAYRRIVESLAHEGYKPRCRIVGVFSEQGEAWVLERALISHWRRAGERLVNILDGGAQSPMKVPAVREKHRASLRRPETRAKLSAKMKARRARESSEVRAALYAAVSAGVRAYWARRKTAQREGVR